MDTMKLPIQLLSEAAISPARASSGAAGYDLYAAEEVSIAPGEQKLVSTNVAMAIPTGHVGLIRPRSGLAVKYGIDTRAGVIDEDYRGEVKVLLYNAGKDDYKLDVGDRIAQLLVVPVAYPETYVTDSLSNTARGENGFGSTGN